MEKMESNSNSGNQNSITGRQLHQIRLNLGMSQPMFSALLGVSNSHCSRLETGKSPITDKVLQRLTNLIGVSDLSDLSDFSQFQDSSTGGSSTDGKNMDDRNADENGDTETQKTKCVVPRQYDPRGYERDGREIERIRLLRKSLSITQEQFAVALDVSPTWIRQIETGHGHNRKPSDRLLGKIIKVFNVNTSWLLRGEGEMGDISTSAASDAVNISDKKRKSRKLKKIELKDDAQIRYEAIRAVETKQMTVTEACETFGFSRETYYKYKRAYDADGIAGLIMEHKGPWGHRSSDETDEHRSKQPM